MSFFDSIGQPQGQQMTPQQAQRQALADVKKDPHGAIKKAGYNVPDNMDDPMQMVEYLIKSGQVGGPKAQLAMRMMSKR